MDELLGSHVLAISDVPDVAVKKLIGRTRVHPELSQAVQLTQGMMIMVIMWKRKYLKTASSTS